eukprot:NODE_23_length_38171_cov_0.318108.p14 type:complete len:265 gc:universal NODE_23_length_38171_cov_0.318108:22927-22133(-)
MDLDLLTLQRSLLLDPRTDYSSFGVLSIKVKKLSILDLALDKQYKGMDLCLKTQEHCKHFGVQKMDSVIMWDNTNQMFLNIPCNYRHPFNEVIFEFILHGQDKRTWSVINLHLHDIVKASPISTILDIWGAFGRIGKIELELTFSHGCFGYGNSCTSLSKSNSIYTLYPEFKNSKLEQYEFPDYIPSIHISGHQREGKQSYIPNESKDLTDQIQEYFSNSKRCTRLSKLKKSLVDQVEPKEFLQLQASKKTARVAAQNMKRFRQ